MGCTDVRRLLPPLALGDLDAEPAAAVADHLQTCADCRGANAAIARTVGLLRTSPTRPPSTERRSAVVGAMIRAHEERSVLLLRRPRRTWAPWIAAARAF